MRHQNTSAAVVKNDIMFVCLAAVWGAVIGFIMLLVFSSPVLQLKYIFRYAFKSVLISTAIAGGLGALLGILQLLFIRNKKI